MKKFLKELLISVILSIVFIMILSLVISNTSVSEKIIMPGIILISSFSILFGGLQLGKYKKEKGIINGVILGCSYMFFMYIISSIITNDFSVTQNSIIMIFGGMIGGAIGGIIGVNLK